MIYEDEITEDYYFLDVVVGYYRDSDYDTCIPRVKGILRDWRFSSDVRIDDLFTVCIFVGTTLGADFR